MNCYELLITVKRVLVVNYQLQLNVKSFKAMIAIT